MNDKNTTALIKNRAKIDALKKQKFTKLNALAMWMLCGNAVSGISMRDRFNIMSYRDAIYDLGKKGYNITYKDFMSKSGSPYRVWWLSCYDEGFVRIGNADIFNQ